METRANYVLVGSFTLAVIAAAFLFVFWFSGGDRGQGRQTVRIVFNGSVAGLSRGSFVAFNGLRVGEVTDLRLLPEDPRRVVALVEVDRATPVRTDTRARLEFGGLTGVASVALVGGEPSATPLQPGPGQPLPTIFADRSDFQDLLETARSLARRADEVLEGISKVVTDNSGDIRRTVQNITTFSDALAANAPGIDRFLAQVGQAAERIGPLAAKLETLADDVTGLVRSVDRQRVANTVENIESFTGALAENRQNVSNALRDFSTLAGRLNESAAKLDTTLADVSSFVKAVDSQKINNTLTNVESFTKTLADNRQSVETILRDVQAIARSVDPAKVGNTLANVEIFSQTLADNRENVGNALRDVSGLARRLNESAPKLDMALTEIANLAKAIDSAAINRVVGNADKFTQALGNSAPDVERAIKEARSIAEKLNRSADRVDGVLKAAEQFLGTASGPQGESTFGEIREAAKSFRRLADNLDKRTAEITAGISRFTTTGAREVESFATEGRRTATDIGRAARSLERNPQQLLFGGRPNIPQYNGSR